jgi:hypothetical protein
MLSYLPPNQRKMCAYVALMRAFLCIVRRVGGCEGGYQGESHSGLKRRGGMVEMSLSCDSRLTVVAFNPGHG